MAALGDFLQDLASRATRCGLEPSEIRPGETIGVEGIYAMPLAFAVRGKGSAVYALIREVETMKRMTRIDRFSVKADVEHEGIVEAQVSMRIYYMNL